MNCNIADIIRNDEYNFLRDNTELKDNICLLTLGGSYAYGTNIESSDIDIRGIATNSKKNILLRKDFEQVVDINTDTTIYSFDKILKLLANCNPNTIEMLGCKKEHYITNEIGDLILKNKEIFLSKKVIYTFGGYANAQLRRLQNALARDSYKQDERLNHIFGTISHMIPELNSRYSFGENNLNIYIDKADINSGYENEIYFDVNLQHYPIRDFNGFISEMTNVVKQYDKLGKRNTKKDDLHLNKHMMHLVRLYLMCFDILEFHEINTYRENDISLLMDIRNGKFLKDGKVDNEFFDLINKLEDKLNKLSKTTTLPENPDYKRINNLQIYINNIICSQ